MRGKKNSSMTTHIGSLYSQCMHSIIQVLCAGRSGHTFFILTQQLKKDVGLVPVFAYLIIEEQIRRYPAYVQDDVLQLITYKNIKSLVVKGCTNITCKGLAVVLQRCKNIQCLDLSECHQLCTNELVDVLRGYGKSLKTLRLDKIMSLNDTLLQEILHYCPVLEELSCDGCVGLQDSSFLKPTGGSGSLGCYLTVVNVSCCENVTNTFVRHLAEVTGPKLKCVNISWTNADSISLLYLAGYTLSTAVEVAHVSRSLQDHVVRDIELAKVLEEEKNRRRSKRPDTSEGMQRNIESNTVHFDCTDQAVVEHTFGPSDLKPPKDEEILTAEVSSPSVESFFADYDVIEIKLPGCGEEMSLVQNDDGFDDNWDILSLDDIKIEPFSSRDQLLPGQPISKDTTTNFQESGHNQQISLSENTSPRAGAGAQNEQFHRLFSPVLTSLDITDIHFNEFSVSQRCIELFVKSNPDLVELHMSWIEMNNEILGIIAQNEINLQNISLVGSEKITGDGISVLVEHCKQLKRIDIKGLPFINDGSLIKMIENNPSIQYFGLAESPLSDRVLDKISEQLQQSVRHLDLSWCENITNVGVVNVLSRCEKLSYLNLRQCKVSHSTIETITKYGRILTEIGLCGSGGLDDSTCQRMLRGLPNLRSIDFSWSACITDGTIEVMFNVCPRLHIVTMLGLKLITTKAFLPIIPQYKEWYRSRGIDPDRLNEKRKNIGNECEEVYIPFRSVNYASQLELLSLGYCDKVNDDCLSEILAVCRGTLVIEGYFGEAMKPKWTDIV